MEYRNRGNSGLKGSLVGLGCNNLGRQVDAAGTVALVNKCVELGVHFFDCADMYGNLGLAEQCLGAAVKPHRQDVVLATKVGAGMRPGIEERAGASRRYIPIAVEACLKRLNTDTIDLLQIHFPDPSTPIEETLRALDDLITAGKVRYIGCCNFSAVDVVEAAWTAKTKDLTPFISAQNRYNVIECRIPAELASACERHGLGFLPYYPLAAGLLTGKYRAGEPPPPGTRLATPSRYYDGILCEKNFARLAKLEAFARERNRSILELAIGWLASQRIVSSVICGATKPEQIETNVRSSGWRLTGEEMAAIDALLEIQ